MNKYKIDIKRMLSAMLLIAVVLSLYASSAAAYTQNVKIPIGSYKGITAYSNGPDTGGPNGYWQCVEYVKRFSSSILGVSGWSGNAYTYYGQATSRGLNAYRNGGSVPPAPNDILVFSGHTYGHVAVITGVSASSVNIIEQNWNSATAYATLPKSGNSISTRSGYTITGWVHKGPLVAITSPGGGGHWSRLTYHTTTWQYRTDLGMNAANIDLVSANGVVTSLAKNIPLSSSGSSSYTWLVTQPLGQYRIKVTLLIKNTSSAQYSAKSNVFYIN